MSGKPFATGRCQCGAVSYTLAEPPVTMGQCHCKDCQRVTGTGHISLARFKREHVTIEGTTKTFCGDGRQRQHQHAPLLSELR